MSRPRTGAISGGIGTDIDITAANFAGDSDLYSHREAPDALKASTTQGAQQDSSGYSTATKSSRTDRMSDLDTILIARIQTATVFMLKKSQEFKVDYFEESPVNIKASPSLATSSLMLEKQDLAESETSSTITSNSSRISNSSNNSSSTSSSYISSSGHGDSSSSSSSISGSLEDAKDQYTPSDFIRKSNSLSSLEMPGPASGSSLQNRKSKDTNSRDSLGCGIEAAAEISCELTAIYENQVYLSLKSFSMDSKTCSDNNIGSDSSSVPSVLHGEGLILIDSRK